MRVNWEGKPSFMHVFIDTTDIVKLEEANNNIRCQKIMFASASHEFRTPLNAIMNSYRFIEDTFNTIVQGIECLEPSCIPAQEIVNLHSTNINKFIHMGYNSSVILLALVEDILDLSKLEAGTFSTVMSDFLVSELVQEVFDIFHIQCKQKDLLLTVEVEPMLRYQTVHSDRGRLKQILLNLMSNAFKFTFNGSITIYARTTTHDDKEVVLFKVIDTEQISTILPVRL